MLSNMVNLHPDLLSISEFFTSLSSHAFQGQRMTGEALFQKLDKLPPGGGALLKNGLTVDEFLYPLGPQARYLPENVPPLCARRCRTLPTSTNNCGTNWPLFCGNGG